MSKELIELKKLVESFCTETFPLRDVAYNYLARVNVALDQVIMEDATTREDVAANVHALPENGQESSANSSEISVVDGWDKNEPVELRVLRTIRYWANAAAIAKNLPNAHLCGANARNHADNAIAAFKPVSGDPRVTHSLTYLHNMLDRRLSHESEAEAAWADDLLEHVKSLKEILHVE